MKKELESIARRLENYCVAPPADLKELAKRLRTLAKESSA